MTTIQTILAIAALILGIVGVIEANGRSGPSWGVNALACIVLVGRFG